MPQDGVAWANRIIQPLVQSHHMMVSLFPYDLDDTTGIPAGKAVTIQAKAVTWRTFGSILAPVQPAAAVAPDDAGAINLALSFISAVALAAQIA